MGLSPFSPRKTKGPKRPNLCAGILRAFQNNLPCMPHGNGLAKSILRAVNDNYSGSVASRPSCGAPVPDEPINSLRPSLNVRSRPLPLSEPSLA